ncbi:MAG: ABC transporter permease [Catenulispora sp.]|nr:ABC transporter permease [Catenulispora sp.]
MIHYTLKRLAAALLILLVICALTFVVFYVTPADPAQGACGKACTPERLSQIRHLLGIDRPVWSQFFSYVHGIFAGRTYGVGPDAVRCPFPCLGFSFQNNQPVASELAERLPISISIALGAAVLWVVVGVTAGVVSALKAGTWWDRGAMVAALGGLSLPIYFTGLALQFLLVTKLGWLPYPTATALTDDPGGWFESMLMPWITLAALYAGLYARITRGEVLENLERDFVRTARAKGLPERTVIRRHAIRPGLTPIATIFGMDLGALLGGALITETVFGLPGVGKLAADAIAGGDQPVILGVTLLVAGFIVVANVAVDLLYAALDPRVRSAT